MNDDIKHTGFSALDDAAATAEADKNPAENNTSGKGQKGGQSQAQKTDKKSSSYKDGAQAHESEDDDSL